jgi:hypothetical protein
MVQIMERFRAGYEEGFQIYKSFENYKVSVLVYIFTYISGGTEVS